MPSRRNLMNDQKRPSSQLNFGVSSGQSIPDALGCSGFQDGVLQRIEKAFRRYSACVAADSDAVTGTGTVK